jgi:hypothetical protein
MLVMAKTLATCSLPIGGLVVFWLAGKQDREAEAFLFLLFAVVALSRTLLLAFRHRPYRHSLALALVLLAISGFLTLIARLTPEPVPVGIGAVDRRGYRVRLNGADHQWGKDPLKEVVG